MADETPKATFSAAVVARCLDLSEADFYKLVRSGVIPKAGQGSYPLAGAYLAYVRYLKQQINATTVDPEKLDPFKRRAHYQAEADKLVLQQKRGELVPRIEMEQALAHVAKVNVECLQTLPDKLERAGLPLKFVKIAEQECNAVLIQMHERHAGYEDVRKRA